MTDPQAADPSKGGTGSGPDGPSGPRTSGTAPHPQCCIAGPPPANVPARGRTDGTARARTRTPSGTARNDPAEMVLLEGVFHHRQPQAFLPAPGGSACSDMRDASGEILSRPAARGAGPGFAPVRELRLSTAHRESRPGAGNAPEHARLGGQAEATGALDLPPLPKRPHAATRARCEFNGFASAGGASAGRIVWVGASLPGRRACGRIPAGLDECRGECVVSKARVRDGPTGNQPQELLQAAGLAR